MSMQALLIRATFLAMLAIGLSLAILHSHANKQPTASSHVNVSTPAVAQSSQSRMAQPRVVEPVIIMLPTITVRSNIKAIADNAHTSSPVDASSSSADSEQRKMYDVLTPSLTKLRLDMPYYSFAKSAHASKE